jgi:benzoyl-CoA reductase/2-hydroxyglutaryl-CoA dehydratase subunit BcrC/BadD/HgdB
VALKNNRFVDAAPGKISLIEWSDQFRRIGNDLIQEYLYYDNKTWGIYLTPPATFMVYGARELKRLRLDNSLASLRMWGFVFTESERLFRARQSGKKVIAAMGDLGIVPCIIMAFPGCIPFYPECVWWTPFFRESTDLLDAATQLGAPEAACFVRAAVSAFHKKAYFPEPELLIASTGASCDDYSCVMQLVEDLGPELLWLEIPARRIRESATETASEHRSRFENYLVNEYQRTWDRMSRLTRSKDTGYSGLQQSIRKANRLRTMVESIKALNRDAPCPPLPALEMMIVEFGNLYGYADIDEWISIVEMIHETVAHRVDNNTGVGGTDAVPIAWITPSADPLLLNVVEDLGCRVVETEYVINQALVPIDENIEPFRALARAFYDASLIGSTESRVERIRQAAREHKIKGVLITNMLGASHCAMETRLIERLITEVPVVSIDVPMPSSITGQLRTRLEAFVETMR